MSATGRDAVLRVPNWEKCDESLPDSHRLVMIYCPDAPDEPVWIGYHNGEQWLSIADLPLVHTVTHWTDLPEPPEEMDPGIRLSNEVRDFVHRVFPWTRSRRLDLVLSKSSDENGIVNLHLDVKAHPAGGTLSSASQNEHEGTGQ